LIDPHPTPFGTPVLAVFSAKLPLQALSPFPVSRPDGGAHTVWGVVHLPTFPHGNEKKGAIQMAKRIYVGGLPYSFADQDLENLFAAHGEVTSAQVVSDRYTGQSKGFGFVEMSEADGTAAINSLNGTSVAGRSITVNEARPREERSSGGGGGGGGRGRW
jgi:hypothetical protein